MALNDSPVSRLSGCTELSSDDLFLVSKKLSSNNDKYCSNKITYNDVVINIISSMGHDLSTITQNQLSNLFGGTVTLVTWK